MNDTDNELIVLLDESFEHIGSAPKLASHHANTPLHLAFSCYLFNQAGDVLITQRAHCKKVWPGVWTGSFCGHPMPDESFEDAIRRRASFELGITGIDGIQKLVPDYRYTTPPYKGIIENEFCPLFIAQLQSELHPNPDEVEDYRWMTWQAFAEDARTNEHLYSYWSKEQVELLTPLLAKSPVGA